MPHEGPQLGTGQALSGVGLDEVEDDAFEDGGVALAGRPGLAELLEGLGVECLVSVVVNLGEIAEDAGADDGGADGEDFRLDIVVIL